MARKDDKTQSDSLDDIPHVRKEPRPDFSKPLPPSKLPKEILDTLNDEEQWWDLVTSGRGGETTDSNMRYAAYATRLRTIMLAAQRYVAYTSDIGESFRPVAHPNLIRAAYGVSWAYLGGDVAYEGYKAYTRNQHTLHPELIPAEEKAAMQDAGAETALQKPGRVVPIEDYRAVMAQRAVFQSIASMGLPAFTIHSIVRYSGRAMKDIKNAKLRTWGPIGLGLAAVPALPFLFDKPVEHATEWVFHSAFKAIGGPSAVGHTVSEGGKPGKVPEKEL